MRGRGSRPGKVEVDESTLEKESAAETVRRVEGRKRRRRSV